VQEVGSFLSSPDSRGKILRLRFIALSRPLPEDQALFSELDLVLTDIRRCYMELDRFWTEEIYRAIEALKMRRVDPTDLERWKNFHANPEISIDSWKVKCRCYSCAALLTNQNSLFRISYQVVILKPYVAIQHVHLRLVHFCFYLCISLD
jgi:hypothetical protein